MDKNDKIRNNGDEDVGSLCTSISLGKGTFETTNSNSSMTIASVTFHNTSTCTKNSSTRASPMIVIAGQEKNDNHHHSRRRLSSEGSNHTVEALDTASTISSSSTASSTCTCKSINNSSENTTTSSARKYPCLYIRANDLVANLQKMSSDDMYHHTDNDDNHDVFIKPHPMIHLDEDSTQLFIPLTSTCTYADDKNTKNEQEQEEEDQPSLQMYSSPYLPFVMDTLLQNGLHFVNNQQHWTYYHQLSIQTTFLNDVTFPNIDNLTTSNNRFNTPLTLSQPIITLSKNQISSLQNDVLLWTYNGNGDNNSHNDIPNPPNSFAIRACGIVPMKPCDLYNLLLDSKRNKEYNLYSCGRNDIWMHDYHDDKGTCSNNFDGCDADVDFDHLGQQPNRITKVCHGLNKPPLVRQAIPYLTLIHGQDIKTKPSSVSLSKGYSITTRSTHQVDANGVLKNSNSYATEIIIGSTLLLPISCSSSSAGTVSDENLTLFINATFVKSPIPSQIAKKVGLSGAVSYVNGLRAICKK